MSEKKKSDSVALIADPFGIKNLEISEAQGNSEELALDEPRDEETVESQELETLQDEDDGATLEPLTLEKDDEQLAKVAEALKAEEETRAALLEAQAPSSEETARADAELLARQIAEDQALQAELAREAAEAEAALEQDPELQAALPKPPVADETGAYDLSELESCLETLLFMLDRPASVAKLKGWLGPDFADELFTQALQGLQARYATPHHGIELLEVSGGWQLRTKPGRAALAKKLAKVQNQRLSAGGMETLAIVAYRQPVMKEEIDKIRGVDSSYFIRGLMEKKLIAITGRSELVGRPMLYSTTETFLELFGLKDLAAMPPLRELESMVPSSQSDNPEHEDPRVREMRKLVGQMKSDTSTSLIYDPREDEKLLQEIRERVQSIPTSTAYLDEQKELEKQAKLAAKAAAAGGSETEPVLDGAQLDLSESAPVAPETPAPEPEAPAPDAP